MEAGQVEVRPDDEPEEGATATSPATRLTALLTAEPIPDCCSEIAPRIVEVSGATVAESPRPNRSTPGAAASSSRPGRSRSA